MLEIRMFTHSEKVNYYYYFAHCLHKAMDSS